MQHSASWKWWDYYWNFCKHFGMECYRTWRLELAASVLVAFFVFVLNGDWKDFRTALFATALALGCFAIWHLLRVPFLLHKSVNVPNGASENHPALAGIFGVLVIAGVFIGGYEFSIQIWNARPLGEIKSVLPSANSNAKDAEIAQLKQENSDLRARHPPSPTPPQLITPPKRFTTKTAAELLALFRGRTMLQGDELIQPFKRMWIKTEGRIQVIGPDNKGAAVAFVAAGEAPVDCRFGEEKWITPLKRYGNGDIIKVVGWIGDNQSGQQLYLFGCELVE